VALLAALDRLTPGRQLAADIAAGAQRVETELLRQQSGIQDQIAAAHGGISLIDMTEYPGAAVERVQVSAAVEAELEARLALIYVGRTHSSSETHEMVIRRLEDSGAEAPELRVLRLLPGAGRSALETGDLRSFGRVMTENTEAQRALHPDLIGERHQEIIDVASAHGATGWKVNGAGGAGGSVTLLGPADRRAQRRMIEAVLAANAEFRNIPVRICHTGVRSWIVRSAKLIE
jgi:D-glycero-alpha-D-manno-heptose-7-phosphate kinase